MPEHIVRLIPRDPYFIFNCDSAKHLLQKVDEILQPINSGKDTVTFKFLEKPEFIDCGSNLESIHCPSCGKILDFEWWGKAMDFANSSDFKNLLVEAPCCNARISLNEIKYDMDCGFATFCICMDNPRNEPSQDILRQIEETLDFPVKMIIAHY